MNPARHFRKYPALHIPTAALIACLAWSGTFPLRAQGLPPAASGQVPALDPSSATLAPPAVDSGRAQAPLEAVSLSTQAAFSQPSARVGDSLDYVLQVEWKDGVVPVVVLAPDSIAFAGFKVIGQATLHKKLAGGAGAGGDEVRNHTEFIYRLRAVTQGSGRAAALKLRYLSGISKNEEAVYVPAALLDIGAAPVGLMDRLWFKLLAGLILLAAAVAGIRFLLGKIQAKKSAAPARLDLRPAVAALKPRIKSASLGTVNSKDILLEMEALCVRYLGEQNGTSAAPGAPVGRFEPLLEAHLRKQGVAPTTTGSAPTATAGDWDRLRDLFRQARFAGGQKEAHELQDAYKTLEKCLNLTGDDEHE